MSDDSRLGAPPAGWRYDSRTGSTRWWDGTRWTDHSRPLDPVVRTLPKRAEQVSSTLAMDRRVLSAAASSSAPRNAAADSGLVFLVIAGLAVAVGAWLGPGMAAATATVLGFAQLALAVTAFALSLTGLAIAAVRSTSKSRATVGLLLSAVLVAFLVFRLVAGGV
ncbi:DUF2510 domain-containing protein [Microbacterium sp. NPDC057407]|uniref:DUF2510 domain-containing protein n=1 Tax=Microbacterium sp. NPDC057407 TaxID=3346120 RepID=UPI00366FF752